MKKGKKHEQPLKLNIPFEEVLKRFSRVDKKELEKELDKYREEKEKK